MPDLIVRNYTEEDIPSIVGLYNSSRVGSPHFVRDESYFKHFTNYPGVSPQSIFVAARGDSILGVLIASVSERDGYKEGKAIEVWAEEDTIVEALLQRAVHYCENESIDMLYVRLPARLAQSQAFAEWTNIGQEGVTMVKALDPLPLLRALYNGRVRNLCQGKNFLFVLDDKAIEMKPYQDSVDVAEANTESLTDGYIKVTMSSRTFLEVVFGLISPYLAYLTGRIKIQGIRNTFTVLKLLRAIRVDIPWSIALVDDL